MLNWVNHVQTDQNEHERRAYQPNDFKQMADMYINLPSVFSRELFFFQAHDVCVNSEASLLQPFKDTLDDFFESGTRFNHIVYWQVTSLPPALVNKMSM